MVERLRAQGIRDERVLGAQIAVDSLTGGSPNGAVAQKSVQTFATPSGSSLTQTPRRGDDDDHEQLYTIAAGRQPLASAVGRQQWATEIWPI